jgi:hypothetical protein
MDPVTTFSFGARLSPALPFRERGRLWLTAGVGWGRLEFDRMEVTEPGREPFVVRERSASFAEIPIGLGASYEIVPRWLTIEIEATGAFVLGQEGSSERSFQAIDSSGKMRSIAGLPLVDATFVQTLGLSLLL